MKEYDIESAKRKFEETLLFYRDADNELKNGYCYRILTDVDDFAYLINPNDVTRNPLYMPIQNGFYENKETPEGYTLLIRKPDKTYKIGICPQTHSFLTSLHAGLFASNKQWAYTNLSKQLEITKDRIEQSLTVAGPISNKIWLTSDTVYFLAKPVGNRKGNKYVVNESMKRELKKVLKDFNPTFWA